MKKKTKVKAPVDVLAHLQSLSLTDMRRFYKYTDWSKLWEQFYLSVDSHNQPKYKTLFAFVKEVAKSKDQRKFLSWYLGPVDEDSKDYKDQAKLYSFVPDGAVDWLKRRDTGGWHTEETLKRFTKEIRNKWNALESLREAGNTLILPSLVRYEHLSQQLDDAFKGTFFIPGISFKEMEERAEAYLKLHSRLLDLKGSAQDLYAKAHGINFADMSGLVQIMTAQAMAASQKQLQEGGASKHNAVLTSLVDMITEKAAIYKMPLPDDMNQKIIDVTNQTKKKKELQ